MKNNGSKLPNLFQWFRYFYFYLSYNIFISIDTHKFFSIFVKLKCKIIQFQHFRNDRVFLITLI